MIAHFQLKEANWEDCLANGTARRISPDTQRAKSLRETAKERIDLIQGVSEKNCNFVFEDYYTSLLEVVQAIAFENGFNILNHVSLGYYLRDVLKKGELYQLFDIVRFNRNSLVYYGNRMDFETAKKAIAICQRALNELQ